MLHALRTLLLPLILCQAALCQSGSRTELGVPGHGTLVLELPQGWREVGRNTPAGLPPTLELQAPAPLRGTLQLTPMWNLKNQPGFDGEAMAKTVALAIKDKFQTMAVENELPLIPIQGFQGRGFRFSATDRDFRPGSGQYPVFTTGVVGAGKLQLVFTILSDAKEDESVQAALGVIRRAALVPETLPSTISIPGAGWAISIESPRLVVQRNHDQGGNYTYAANGGRFNLSIFVEPPANSGTQHGDCFNHYWPLRSRNPSIDKASIQVLETVKFVRVQYQTMDTLEGECFTLRHVNYFFAFQGKWIDVHISIVQPDQADENIFATFDRALDYAMLPAASKAAVPNP